MRQHGAVGVAFDLIIISGKKTSMPHGVPDDKKLEYGDLYYTRYWCRCRGI